MADAAPRFAFEVVDGFAESDLGQLLVPRMQTVMADEGLDVAAFEFILDPDGRPYVYDINTNTNYNSDAESRAGVSAMGQLAAYLGDELEARYPAESRRASQLMSLMQEIGGYYVMSTLGRRPVSAAALSKTYKLIARELGVQPELCRGFTPHSAQ